MFESVAMTNKKYLLILIHYARHVHVYMSLLLCFINIVQQLKHEIGCGIVRSFRAWTLYD